LRRAKVAEVPEAGISSYRRAVTRGLALLHDSKLELGVELERYVGRSIGQPEQNTCRHL
jgi:hypothetical protein